MPRLWCSSVLQYCDIHYHIHFMQISIATEDFASFNVLPEPGSVATVDQMVIFEEQQTVLDIEKEGVVLDSGWTITPHTHPVGLFATKPRKCQFAMQQCSNAAMQLP